MGISRGRAFPAERTASARAMTQVTCSGGSRENSGARVEQASKQEREWEEIRTER